MGAAEKGIRVATHADCSGCGLCVLVCPPWRATRDQEMTPHGRAKALQHGATASDIAASVESCTLCGACEPICPENIPIVDLTLELRRSLCADVVDAAPVSVAVDPASPLPTVFIPDAALRGAPGTLNRTVKALGGEGAVSVASDDGSDIAAMIESGGLVPEARLGAFLAPLARVSTVIVASGLLMRRLRSWLPKTTIASLGSVLRDRGALKSLRADDLYVIEPRAFHAEHAGQVLKYDDLRAATGCAMNLDLQRLAISPVAYGVRTQGAAPTPQDIEQAYWIMKGRAVKRVVVEDLADRAAFEAAGMPVVHIADLADS